MLIPEVLPDEIARGYLGRLRTMNGFRSPEDAVNMLRKRMGEQGGARRGAPVACLLSKALQMPTEAFCRQHTMLPYIRAVTNHLPDMKHGAAGTEGVVRRSGMWSPRPGGFFCRSCVTEDMDFWGYSYFRRSHQLPGVFCCEKHHEPLLQVAAEKAFYLSPYQLLEQVVPSEPMFPASIAEHPAISRYLAITAHWLSAERPLPASRLFEVLHKRANSLGIRKARKKRRKLLSDLAIKVFPEGWLSQMFPDLPNKAPLEFYGPLDAIVGHAATTCRSESYALALAMFFETPEAALDEIDHPIPPGQVQPWGSEEFFRLYVEGRGSSNYIDEKSGRANKWHTRKVMKAVGLPALGRYSDASLRAVLDVAARMDIHEACARRGARVSVVRKLAPVISDRFVSAITEILRKQNGSVADLLAKPVI